MLVYDDLGRHVRTVTESPWTEEDRALLLAYRVYLDSICDGCGQEKRLAHHPDNDGWFKVPEPLVCHGCTALQRKAQEDSKEPVKPVELFRVIHDRDYTTHPLPVLNPDAVAERPAGW